MANKRDELIEKYATALRDKFDIEPDMVLLKKVTIGLGPSIYNRDSANVSGTDEKELQRVKENFLIGKLGLKESDDLDAAIREIMDRYGASERTKYRAVIYYLLARKFGKEEVYG
ncbi:DUF2853 family protein [Muriicola marianensis]|uniref:DUF2853 family protein n=1 Tax=Muriicola marianensis TaxID=1324801 RepID=A0ABQ1QQR1_9FLAO|nr:DUF2853 family protein [Muriicola marianensis]GGD37742.1 hypothetical protein GCM10011361_01020 [Muriicola marianensis]